MIHFYLCFWAVWKNYFLKNNTYFLDDRTHISFLGKMYFPSFIYEAKVLCFLFCFCLWSDLSSPEKRKYIIFKVVFYLLIHFFFFYSFLSFFPFYKLIIKTKQKQKKILWRMQFHSIAFGDGLYTVYWEKGRHGLSCELCNQICAYSCRFRT